MRESSVGRRRASADNQSDERLLWRIGDLECVMISCCSGAELQLRRGDAIMLRELYPMKSDLYDRARELRSERQSSE